MTHYRAESDNAAEVQFQLPLAEARRARDAGMQLASDHAEGVEPGWSAACYRVLCDFARQTGQFTSEHFRSHLARIGFPVPVPKALGPVLRRAAKAGVIVKLGFGIAKDRHLSPTVLWGRA